MPSETTSHVLDLLRGEGLPLSTGISTLRFGWLLHRDSVEVVELLTGLRGAA